MKIGYCKKTEDTKNRMLELMPEYLKGLNLFLNLGYSKSKGFKGYEWINKPYAVKRAINKKKMFYFFKKKGVKSVRFIDLEWFGGKIEGLYYLIRGNTLVVKKNGLKLVNLFNFWNIFDKDYATIKERKILEYRIIVFKGRIVRILLKSKQKGGFQIKQENSRFIEVGEEGFKKKDLDNIINSVKALGLDLAGVDVLINSNENFKVIEVNSGMGMKTKSIKKLFKLIWEVYK